MSDSTARYRSDKGFILVIVVVKIPFSINIFLNPIYYHYTHTMKSIFDIRCRRKFSWIFIIFDARNFSILLTTIKIIDVIFRQDSLKNFRN